MAQNIPLQEMILFSDLIPDSVTEKSKIFSFPDSAVSNQSTDVLVGEKTVIVKEQVYNTGVSVNGKTWHSWKTRMTTIYSLKKERYGNHQLRVYSVIPKTRKRGRGFFRDISRTAMVPRYKGQNCELHTEAFFEGRYTKRHVFSSVAAHFAIWNLVQKWKELNPAIDLRPVPVENLLFYMAYPALQMFVNCEFKDVRNALRSSTKPWLGEPDVRIFLKQVLGKEAVRKDFIKATAKLTDANIIQACSGLKGSVPVDWFLPWFEEGNKSSILRSGRVDYSPDLWSNLKRLFVRASISQKRRMFVAEVSEDKRVNDSRWVTDAIRMLEEINDDILDEAFPDIDFANWKSIHDSMVNIHRVLQMKPQPVPQAGLMEHLDEKSYFFGKEKYVIRSPKMNQELIVWGSELSNCIASYNNAVLMKHTDVFAVYKEDKLYANLEVHNGRLVQFVERFNRQVPEEMKVKMNLLIGKAGKAEKEKLRKEKARKDKLVQAKTACLNQHVAT